MNTVWIATDQTLVIITSENQTTIEKDLQYGYKSKAVEFRLIWVL